MKLPKSFIPDENLDGHTELLRRESIEDLIEDEIDYYSRDLEYQTNTDSDRYIYIISAIKSIDVSYSDYPDTIELTILEFRDRAKFHLKELADELNHGMYSDYRKKYCLIKKVFAIIIYSPCYEEALEAYDKELEYEVEQDLKLFIRHYRNKFGFC